ncbi:MAG: 50S ribosomal protein L29 [Rugosibacter sp.]|jgi:large subunit ribosomal protein L29|nr:large subunit ribosomal protein L29 [Rugosibacter sp.]
MKSAEIRSKSEIELNESLLNLRKTQFSLRMQRATQQLSDNSQINKVRKDIARLKTIQHEKVMVK